MQNKQTNFPFQWQANSIKYLGINLTASLTDLFPYNYTPILQNIKEDIKLWNKPHFSWMGRAAIIKMNILPRLLYFLQTIPIKIPNSFFRTFQSTCNKLLWNQKTPRLSFNLLSKSKMNGGLGIPDLQKYHWPCQLTRILDWSLHEENKDWVSIERAFSSIPLHAMPWIPPDHISPLINTSLSSFKTTSQYFNISSNPGPMTPIKSNPSLIPGLSRSFPCNHWRDRPLRAYQFYNNGTLIDRTDFRPDPASPPIPNWTYFQI